VGARGVVAGLVGHGEGEVRGEVGRLGGDADVGVADGVMVLLVTADAPRGLSRNGAPVGAHVMEGVNVGVFSASVPRSVSTVSGQPQTDSQVR